MLSKKERIIWVSITIISIIITFFITKSTLLPHNFSYQNSLSSHPTSDIEKQADQWFTSFNAPIPDRTWLTPVNKSELDTSMLIYQAGIQKNETWVYYPDQIVLNTFFPPSSIEGYVPDEVSLFYGNRNQYIATVLITEISPAGIGADETRVDLIKINNLWKIVWAGSRSIFLH